MIEEIKHLTNGKLLALLMEYNSSALGRMHMQLVKIIKADPAFIKKYGRKAGMFKTPVRKKERARAITAVVRQKRFARYWIDSLSPDARRVVEHLAWYGRSRLDRLEQVTGITISTEIKQGYSRKIELLREFGFVFLFKSWGHYESAENCYAELPLSLHYAALTALPDPPGYRLIPIKKDIHASYSCCFEAEAPGEVIRGISFISQGYMTLKKNGSPSVKGLADFIKITGMKEFFPGEKGELKYLRAGIVTAVLLNNNAGHKVKPDAAPHNVLKKLFTSWQKGKFVITKSMLPHLKIADRYYCASYNTNIKPVLMDILSDMKPGSCYSTENLVRYTAFRKSPLEEVRRQVLRFRWAEHMDHGSSWQREDRVEDWNFYHVITEPTLKAFFFLAAAFGLVEIGYDLPENPVFKRMAHESLTPFDGLKSVRLTELGAYVVGISKKYQSKAVQDQEVTVKLDSKRLFITLSGSDPLMELTLGKCMENVGTGRFRLTLDSLFRECRTKQAIRERKKMFTSMADGKLPEVWKDFFRLAEQRTHPVKQETAMKVFRLSDDPDLLHIMASDPVISSLVLRVEGKRVAIKDSDITKFKRQLRKYGYPVGS